MSEVVMADDQVIRDIKAEIGRYAVALENGDESARPRIEGLERQIREICTERERRDLAAKERASQADAEAKVAAVARIQQLKADDKALATLHEQQADDMEKSWAVFAGHLAGFLDTGQLRQRGGLQIGLDSRRAETLRAKRLAERFVLNQLAEVLPGVVGRLDRSLRGPLGPAVRALRPLVAEVPDP